MAKIIIIVVNQNMFIHSDLHFENLKITEAEDSFVFGCFEICLSIFGGFET